MDRPHGVVGHDGGVADGGPHSTARAGGPRVGACDHLGWEHSAKALTIAPGGDVREPAKRRRKVAVRPCSVPPLVHSDPVPRAAARQADQINADSSVPPGRGVDPIDLRVERDGARFCRAGARRHGKRIPRWTRSRQATGQDKAALDKIQTFGKKPRKTHRCRSCSLRGSVMPRRITDTNGDEKILKQSRRAEGLTKLRSRLDQAMEMLRLHERRGGGESRADEIGAARRGPCGGPRAGIELLPPGPTSLHPWRPR